MHAQKRLIGSMVLAAAVACGGLGAGAAQGAVLTQLFGGDTTDGVDISSLNIVAGGIYAGKSTVGPLTWQGKNFDQNIGITAVNHIAFTSGVSADSFLAAGNNVLDTAAGAAFTDSATPTTEDNNLLALVNAGLVFSGSTFTATASGLTPGSTYRVDLISAAINYWPRDTQVSFDNNVTKFQIAGYGGEAGHYIYSWYDNAIADASGSITMTFTPGTEAQGPLVNAILVSSVPEPAGLSLLGCALLPLLGRRRNQL